MAGPSRTIGDYACVFESPVLFDSAARIDACLEFAAALDALEHQALPVPQPLEDEAGGEGFDDSVRGGSGRAAAVAAQGTGGAAGLPRQNRGVNSSTSTASRSMLNSNALFRVPEHALHISPHHRLNPTGSAASGGLANLIAGSAFTHSLTEQMLFGATPPTFTTTQATDSPRLACSAMDASTNDPAVSTFLQHADGNTERATTSAGASSPQFPDVTVEEGHSESCTMTTERGRCSRNSGSTHTEKQPCDRSSCSEQGHLGERDGARHQETDEEDEDEEEDDDNDDEGDTSEADSDDQLPLGSFYHTDGGVDGATNGSRIELGVSGSAAAAAKVSGAPLAFNLRAFFQRYAVTLVLDFGRATFDVSRSGEVLVDRFPCVVDRLVSQLAQAVEVRAKKYEEIMRSLSKKKRRTLRTVKRSLEAKHQSHEEYVGEVEAALNERLAEIEARIWKPQISLSVVIANAPLLHQEGYTSGSSDDDDPNGGETHHGSCVRDAGDATVPSTSSNTTCTNAQVRSQQHQQQQSKQRGTDGSAAAKDPRSPKQRHGTSTLPNSSSTVGFHNAEDAMMPSVPSAENLPGDIATDADSHQCPGAVPSTSSTSEVPLLPIYPCNASYGVDNFIPLVLNANIIDIAQDTTFLPRVETALHRFEGAFRDAAKRHARRNHRHRREARAQLGRDRHHHHGKRKGHSGGLLQGEHQQQHGGGGGFPRGSVGGAEVGISAAGVDAAGDFGSGCGSRFPPWECLSVAQIMERVLGMLQTKWAEPETRAAPKGVAPKEPNRDSALLPPQHIVIISSHFAPIGTSESVTMLTSATSTKDIMWGLMTLGPAIDWNMPHLSPTLHFLSQCAGGFVLTHSQWSTGAIVDPVRNETWLSRLPAEDQCFASFILVKLFPNFPVVEQAAAKMEIFGHVLRSPLQLDAEIVTDAVTELHHAQQRAGALTQHDTDMLTVQAYQCEPFFARSAPAAVLAVASSRISEGWDVTLLRDSKKDENELDCDGFELEDAHGCDSPQRSERHPSAASSVVGCVAVLRPFLHHGTLALYFDCSTVETSGGVIVYRWVVAHGTKSVVARFVASIIEGGAVGDAATNSTLPKTPLDSGQPAITGQQRTGAATTNAQNWQIPRDAPDDPLSEDVEFSLSQVIASRELISLMHQMIHRWLSADPAIVAVLDAPNLAWQLMSPTSTRAAIAAQRIAQRDILAALHEHSVGAGCTIEWLAHVHVASAFVVCAGSSHTALAIGNVIHGSAMMGTPTLPHFAQSFQQHHYQQHRDGALVASPRMPVQHGLDVPSTVRLIATILTAQSEQRRRGKLCFSALSAHDDLSALGKEGTSASSGAPAGLVAVVAHLGAIGVANSAAVVQILPILTPLTYPKSCSQCHATTFELRVTFIGPSTAALAGAQNAVFDEIAERLSFEPLAQTLVASKSFHCNSDDTSCDSAALEGNSTPPLSARTASENPRHVHSGAAALLLDTLISFDALPETAALIQAAVDATSVEPPKLMPDAHSNDSSSHTTSGGAGPKRFDLESRVAHSQRVAARRRIALHKWLTTRFFSPTAHMLRTKSYATTTWSYRIPIYSSWQLMVRLLAQLRLRAAHHQGFHVCHMTTHPHFKVVLRRANSFITQGRSGSIGGGPMATGANASTTNASSGTPVERQSPTGGARLSGPAHFTYDVISGSQQQITVSRTRWFLPGYENAHAAGASLGESVREDLDLLAAIHSSSTIAEEMEKFFNRSGSRHRLPSWYDGRSFNPFASSRSRTAALNQKRSKPRGKSMPGERPADEVNHFVDNGGHLDVEGSCRALFWGITTDEHTSAAPVTVTRFPILQITDDPQRLSFHDGHRRSSAVVDFHIHLAHIVEMLGNVNATMLLSELPRALQRALLDVRGHAAAASLPQGDRRQVLVSIVPCMEWPSHIDPLHRESVAMLMLKPQKRESAAPSRAAPRRVSRVGSASHLPQSEGSGGKSGITKPPAHHQQQESPQTDVIPRDPSSEIGRDAEEPTHQRDLIVLMIPTSTAIVAAGVAAAFDFDKAALQPPRAPSCSTPSSISSFATSVSPGTLDTTASRERIGRHPPPLFHATPRTAALHGSGEECTSAGIIARLQFALKQMHGLITGVSVCRHLVHDPAASPGGPPSTPPCAGDADARQQPDGELDHVDGQLENEAHAERDDPPHAGLFGNRCHVLQLTKNIMFALQVPFLTALSEAIASLSVALSPIKGIPGGFAVDAFRVAALSQAEMISVRRDDPRSSPDNPSTYPHPPSSDGETCNNMERREEHGRVVSRMNEPINPNFVPIVLSFWVDVRSSRARDDEGSCSGSDGVAEHSFMLPLSDLSDGAVELPINPDDVVDLQLRMEVRTVALPLMELCRGGLCPPRLFVRHFFESECTHAAAMAQHAESGTTSPQSLDFHFLPELLQRVLGQTHNLVLRDLTECALRSTFSTRGFLIVREMAAGVQQQQQASSGPTPAAASATSQGDGGGGNPAPPSIWGKFAAEVSAEDLETLTRLVEMVVRPAMEALPESYLWGHFPLDFSLSTIKALREETASYAHVFSACFSEELLPMIVVPHLPRGSVQRMPLQHARAAAATSPGRAVDGDRSSALCFLFVPPQSIFSAAWYVVLIDVEHDFGVRLFAFTPRPLTLSSASASAASTPARSPSFDQLMTNESSGWPRNGASLASTPLDQFEGGSSVTSGGKLLAAASSSLTSERERQLKNELGSAAGASGGDSGALLVDRVCASLRACIVSLAVRISQNQLLADLLRTQEADHDLVPVGWGEQAWGRRSDMASSNSIASLATLHHQQHSSSHYLSSLQRSASKTQLASSQSAHMAPSASPQATTATAGAVAAAELCRYKLAGRTILALPTPSKLSAKILMSKLVVHFNGMRILNRIGCFVTIDDQEDSVIHYFRLIYVPPEPRQPQITEPLVATAEEPLVHRATRKDLFWDPNSPPPQLGEGARSTGGVILCQLYTAARCPAVQSITDAVRSVFDAVVTAEMIKRLASERDAGGVVTVARSDIKKVFTRHVDTVSLHMPSLKRSAARTQFLRNITFHNFVPFTIEEGPSDATTGDAALSAVLPTAVASSIGVAGPDAVPGAAETAETTSSTAEQPEAAAPSSPADAASRKGTNAGKRTYFHLMIHARAIEERERAIYSAITEIDQDVGTVKVTVYATLGLVDTLTIAAPNGDIKKVAEGVARLYQSLWDTDLEQHLWRTPLREMCTIPGGERQRERLLAGLDPSATLLNASSIPLHLVPSLVTSLTETIQKASPSGYMFARRLITFESWRGLRRERDAVLRPSPCVLITMLEELATSLVMPILISYEKENAHKPGFVQFWDAFPWSEREQAQQDIHIASKRFQLICGLPIENPAASTAASNPSGFGGGEGTTAAPSPPPTTIKPVLLQQTLAIPFNGRNPEAQKRLADTPISDLCGKEGMNPARIIIIEVDLDAGVAAYFYNVREAPELMDMIHRRVAAASEKTHVMSACLLQSLGFAFNANVPEERLATLCCGDTSVVTKNSVSITNEVARRAPSDIKLVIGGSSGNDNDINPPMSVFEGAQPPAVAAPQLPPLLPSASSLQLTPAASTGALNASVLGVSGQAASGASASAPPESTGGHCLPTAAAPVPPGTVSAIAAAAAAAQATTSAPLVEVLPVPGSGAGPQPAQQPPATTPLSPLTPALSALLRDFVVIVACLTNRGLTVNNTFVSGDAAKVLFEESAGASCASFSARAAAGGVQAASGGQFRRLSECTAVVEELVRLGLFVDVHLEELTSRGKHRGDYHLFKISDAYAARLPGTPVIADDFHRHMATAHMMVEAQHARQKIRSCFGRLASLWPSRERFEPQVLQLIAELQAECKLQYGSRVPHFSDRTELMVTQPLLGRSVLGTRPQGMPQGDEACELVNHVIAEFVEHVRKRQPHSHVFVIDPRVVTHGALGPYMEERLACRYGRVMLSTLQRSFSVFAEAPYMCFSGADVPATTLPPSDDHEVLFTPALVFIVEPVFADEPVCPDTSATRGAGTGHIAAFLVAEIGFQLVNYALDLYAINDAATPEHVARRISSYKQGFQFSSVIYDLTVRRLFDQIELVGNRDAANRGALQRLSCTLDRLLTYYPNPPNYAINCVRRFAITDASVRDTLMHMCSASVFGGHSMAPSISSGHAPGRPASVSASAAAACERVVRHMPPPDDGDLFMRPETGERYRYWGLLVRRESGELAVFVALSASSPGKHLSDYRRVSSVDLQQHCDTLLGLLLQPLLFAKVTMRRAFARLRRAGSESCSASDSDDDDDTPVRNNDEDTHVIGVAAALQAALSHVAVSPCDVEKQTLNAALPQLATLDLCGMLRGLTSPASVRSAFEHRPQLLARLEQYTLHVLSPPLTGLNCASLELTIVLAPRRGSRFFVMLKLTESAAPPLMRAVRLARRDVYVSEFVRCRNVFDPVAAPTADEMARLDEEDFHELIKEEIRCTDTLLQLILATLWDAAVAPAVVLLGAASDTASAHGSTMTTLDPGDAPTTRGPSSLSSPPSSPNKKS